MSTLREIGTLIVIVLKARNLPNRRLIGKQHPYCTLSHNYQNRRTRVITRGGQHPEWDEEFRFTLYEDESAHTPNDSLQSPKNVKGGTKMHLTCFADSIRTPDIVGETTVDLTQVLTKGELDEWFPLTHKSKYSGEVYLELTFWSNEPAPVPRKTKVPKPSASNTNNIDSWYTRSPTWEDMFVQSWPPAPVWQESSMDADSKVRELELYRPWEDSQHLPSFTAWHPENPVTESGRNLALEIEINQHQLERQGNLWAGGQEKERVGEVGRIQSSSTASYPLPVVNQAVFQPSRSDTTLLSATSAQSGFPSSPNSMPKLSPAISPTTSGMNLSTVDNSTASSYTAKDQGVLNVHIGPRMYYGVADEITTFSREKPIKSAWTDMHRTQILQWLAAPDHTSNHHDATEIRRPGTGTWILKDPRFRKWIAGVNSNLYLSGMPGSGKTILTATIIDEVEKHCSSTGDLQYAYFYFDFRRNYDTKQFLRSLIYQLSLNFADIPAPLERLWHSHQGQPQPSRFQLVNLLQDLSQLRDKTFFIIDALDECRDLSNLRRVMKSILSFPSNSNIQLLVSTRPDSETEHIFSMAGPAHIQLESDVTFDDIASYIHQRLETDIHLRNLGSSQKSEIQTALLEGSYGMFRWVSCQMDELRWCRSPSKLREALSSLPSSLNEVYDRIIANIDSRDQRDAHLLFQWLAVSEELLTVDELRDALAVDVYGQYPFFNPDLRYHDPGVGIPDLCPSLITLITQRRNCGGEEKTVLCPAFAHHSVQEYIISAQSPLKSFGINARLARDLVSQTCFLYLFHVGAYQSHSIDKSYVKDEIGIQRVDANWLKKEFPLLSYSVRKWQADCEVEPRRDWECSDDTRLLLTLASTTQIRPYGPGKTSIKGW